MATIGVVAGSAWVNLVDDLSLSEDSSYLLQATKLLRADGFYKQQ